MLAGVVEVDEWLFEVEGEVDHGNQALNFKGLLQDDRPLGLQIGKPRLAVERRHNHDRDALVLEAFFKLLEDLNAVHIGHHNVANHQVRRERLKLAQALFAIRGEYDVVTGAAEGIFEHGLKRQIIVYDKDGALRFGHSVPLCRKVDGAAGRAMADRVVGGTPAIIPEVFASFVLGGGMPKVPAVLAAFPYIHWEEVHFKDLDILGHANNVVYASWLESARIRFYLDLMDIPLEEMGLILAELTLSYKTPAYFGERLGIGVRVGTIGSKSFAMEHVIAREGDGVVIATAKAVLVAYDYKLGTTVPVSEEFRRRVSKSEEVR